MKYDRNGRLFSCYDGGLAYQADKIWHALPGGNRLYQDGCQALAVDRLGGVWYGFKGDGAFSLIENPLSAAPAMRRFEDGGEIGTALTFFFDSDSRGWLWRGGRRWNLRGRP